MMKQMLFVLSVAVSAIGAETADEIRTRARQLQNEGSEFLSHGELRRALALFDASQKIDPTYPFPHLGRGIAYAKLKMWHESVTEFDKAIALKPDFHQGHRGRAAALYDTNRLHEALESINQALALRPQSADYMTLRALIHGKSGQLDEALSDANHAIELDPKAVDGYIARGVIYASKKMRVEALENFSRALDLRPGDKYAAAAMKTLTRPDIEAAGSRVTNSGSRRTSVPPLSGSELPSLFATR